MAKVNRILNETRDSVTCAICMEVFKDPRVLSCSHSFCHHCLVAHVGYELGNTPTVCPTCRQPTVPSLDDVEAFPKNVFASKVADMVRQEDTPRTGQLHIDNPGRPDSHCV